MTTIRFDRRAGRILGFSCQGHSGYAEAGEDIVCAAVSGGVCVPEPAVVTVYASVQDQLQRAGNLEVGRSVGLCEGLGIAAKDFVRVSLLFSL